MKYWHSPRLQASLTMFCSKTRFFGHRVPLIGHTQLTEVDPVLHMLGLASPWLETDSDDPTKAEVSAKV